MLKLHGHVFDALPTCACCVGDATAILVDPTGTAPIRKRFRVDAQLKWNALRVMMRNMIDERDLFGLKASALMQPVNAISGGQGKVVAFQRWFDLVLDRTVLMSDGQWMRRHIAASYEDGQAFAQNLINVQHVSLNAKDREDTLNALAVVELQGIQEAVSQQVVRVVANALLSQEKPREIVRDIHDIIDRIGVTRTNAMIEMMVVKAFGDASLDVYAATGVQFVGTIPEAKAITRGVAVPSRDALVLDARKSSSRGRSSKKKTARSRKTGPGSRIRKGAEPSARTLRRIRAAQRELDRLKTVNVRTAGDDDVCPTCEEISEDGPYSINAARRLIPAHPNCRCVFVPVGDKRFSSDAVVAP